MDKISVADAAKLYGYTVSTLYTFLRDAKSGKLKLFPQPSLGPTKRRTPNKLQKLIIKKRKMNMSAREIQSSLVTDNINISASTVERVLADAHFSKLSRRTNIELGNTVKNQIISKRATPIDFDNLQPFHFDCPSIGVFFFLPYIIESGIVDIVQTCKLPQSSSIDARQACLSMLLLKLIGSERLSHIKTYDHEPGFGVFAGLNVLPKASYIATYSCRTSEKTLFDLQKKIVAHFKETGFFQTT